MPDTTEAKPTTSQEEAKLDTGAAADKGTQPPPIAESSAKFTQDDVSRIVKKELAAAKAKAEKDAEAAAAAERGEFEKLSTAYKTELDDIKPRHEATVEALANLLKAELKALPESVRELAPSDDPIQLAAWLPKAKKLAGELEPKSAEPGNARGPKPAGKSGNEAVESAKKTLRARGTYTGF